MPSQKALIESLVDFSFGEFVTLRIIKLLYALHLLVGLIVAIGLVLSGFRESTAQGLLLLILCAVGLILDALRPGIARGADRDLPRCGECIEDCKSIRAILINWGPM